MTEKQRGIDKDFLESIDSNVFNDITTIIKNNTVGKVFVISEKIEDFKTVSYKNLPKFLGKMKNGTINFVYIDNWNCFIVDNDRILWFDPQLENENDLHLLTNMHEYKSEEDEDYEYTEESDDDFNTDSEYESSEYIDYKFEIAKILDKDLHIIQLNKSADKFHKLWILLFAFCYDNKEMDRFTELAFRKHRTKIIKHWTYNILKKLEYNEKEFIKPLSNYIFNSEVKQIELKDLELVEFLDLYK